MTEFEAFYAAIDKQVSALTRLHAQHLQCKAGCCDCCIDGLSVFEIEADNIRATYPDLLENSLPHPAGACAFLDEGGLCRIYEQRPYVCRTQGLPLHWMDVDDDGTFTGFRDICPKNDDTLDIEALRENECWIIGPAEEKLSMMQYKKGKSKIKRIRLRDMFKQQPD